jgi:hypothetical protein
VILRFLAFALICSDNTENMPSSASFSFFKLFCPQSLVEKPIFLECLTSLYTINHKAIFGQGIAGVDMDKTVHALVSNLC